MKSGDSFKLSERWWKENKPLLLTQTGLGEALRGFEKADQAFQSKQLGANYIACMKALEAVDKARKDTISKCGSTESFKTTKEALSKDAVINQRKTVLKLALQSKVEVPIKSAENLVQKETAHVNQVVSSNKKLEENLKVLVTTITKAREGRKKVKMNTKEDQVLLQQIAVAQGGILKIKKSLESQIEKKTIGGGSSIEVFLDSAKTILSQVPEGFSAYVVRIKNLEKVMKENKLKLAGGASAIYERYKTELEIVGD